MTSPAPLFVMTTRDDDLHQAVASRDPLGVQPIWSAHARGLVPHLTAQSNRAAGFQLLLAALWFWETWEDRPPGGRERDFTVLFELMCGHAVARYGCEWPLLGSRRLSAFKGSTATLSLHRREDQLLDNPAGNGVWGLYRGAARRAELITDADQLTDAGRRLIESTVPPELSQHRRRLERAVGPLLEQPDATTKWSMRGNTLLKPLAALVSQLPSASALSDALINRFPLTRRLAAASKVRPEDQPMKDFLVTVARAAEPDERDRVERVLACEAVLAPLEGFFAFLSLRPGRTASEAVKDAPVPLKAVRAALNAFPEPGGATDAAPRQRWANFKSLDLSSRAIFATSLVDIHRQISEHRGVAPWISLDDTGRISVDRDVERPSDEASLDPKRAWNNTYYLPSLARLAADLEAHA